MFKDKSPGVKILWVWTIATAAIMVGNVARTRIRDMDKLMNRGEEPNSGIDSGVANESLPDNPEFVADQISSEAV